MKYLCTAKYVNALKYSYLQRTLCGIDHSLCRSIMSYLCFYILQSIVGYCKKYYRWRKVKNKAKYEYTFPNIHIIAYYGTAIKTSQMTTFDVASTKCSLQ